MKKILVIASVLAFFSACKKDYTCTCTTGSFSSTTTIKDATKRQAQANCVSYKYTSNNVTVETDCSLK